MDCGGQAGEPASERPPADGDRDPHWLAVDGAADGFLVADADGCIVFANRYLAELFGYGREELMGASIDQLVPVAEREEHARARRRLSDGGSPRTMGGRLVWGRRRDGTSIRVEVRLSPWSRDGRQFVSAVVRDAAERDVADARRAARERLQGTGRLSAMLLHEINNPLTAVLANLELARRCLTRPEPMDGRARLAIDDALAAANRIGELVRDLRPLSVPSEERLEVTRLPDVVERALRLVSPALFLRTEVERQVDRDVPPILASEGRLLQVLWNLLVNAGQAIAAQPPDQRRLRVRVEGRGPDVRCVVEDSGPGIPDALRERVFAPQVTSKPTGTGLGLAISRQIVDSLGGTLHASSSELGGAAMVIRLPALEEDPARPELKIGSGSAD